MLKSQRANRMERRHNRGKGGTALNLVSLMDIFTILVFFLMVNSSEVEVLQTNSKIKLPDSTSEQRPENRLVVSIDDQDVVVQGRPVATVAELAEPDVKVVQGLADELAYQASRKVEIPQDGFEVTIMGDRELPYWLLKKIMYTCQQSDFAQISLAVNRMPGPNAEALAEVAADGAGGAT